MPDSFSTLTTFTVNGTSHRYHALPALEPRGHKLARLPYSLKILLENLLRHEDGVSVTPAAIEGLLKWDAKAEPSQEIAFTPARVLMQDFTGVPAVVDLAAMREAMQKMGGDPKKINPLLPTELVIDHSVQVDEAGTSTALAHNAELEFARNHERYAFLRWGQTAFKGFKVVPPDTGIVHQVNLEFLARGVMSENETSMNGDGQPAMAYPDTVVGTDSHTTMINGLGVLGWGVGGIEAEAAMLGQPVTMLIPQVVGVRLTGKLPEGATATDAVLRVTELLRKHGVVGKFVEYFGPGLAELPLADRATIANMSPEYGATCGIFPVDAETLAYLRLSGRSEAQVALVEAYMKAQGLFHDANTPAAEYSSVLELDLATIQASLAGPRRPQDRVELKSVKDSFAKELDSLRAGITAPKPKVNTMERWEGEGGHADPPPPELHPDGGVIAQFGAEKCVLRHGAVVIAAITSCTNTSNPSVMLAAGLLAKKATERGLTSRPWVKTSLAPGSKTVNDYLVHAGLLPFLEKLRFHIVGYGCTTCIGNSGPLPAEVSRVIEQGGLVAAAVLSGNRNFEGRINAEVRANYLASPPLVVAYALAGRMDIDLTTEPLGTGSDGKPVFLRDVWPTQAEIRAAVSQNVTAEQFRSSYQNVYDGDAHWQGLKIPAGDTYAWDKNSTYVKHPPYFADMPAHPAPVYDIQNARVLASFGDSITTDHISPAGSIKASSPAGKYLQSQGVAPADFNSYGARRGNHEVMMRGTFANTRIKNKMVPGVEGGVTRHLPSNEQLSIFDASVRYQADNVPLLILAGKEYGSGSSRDWAAKGPLLLGVKAAIAESYERIHRSNLVGMGILPLQYKPGDSAASLGLTGDEVFKISGIKAGIESGFKNGRDVKVSAKRSDGSVVEFTAIMRIDTPVEIQYYRHGGILQYVLRQLMGG
jgi:aconitate hydratase